MQRIFVAFLAMAMLALWCAAPVQAQVKQSYVAGPSDPALAGARQGQVDLDVTLPPVYARKITKERDAKTGKEREIIRYEIQVKEQKPVNIHKEGKGNTNPRRFAAYSVGAEDLVTYWYIEIPLPEQLRDVDGGTIRLIMQHETDPLDQVRIIDEHIGTEYSSDIFGDRGRFPGRYGWTRQSGGGNHSWILGDNTAHNLATPWNWAWITDYRWRQDNTVLGGDTIRIYSHPHVTTRVIMLD